jgi:hypothetical protein
MVARLSFELVKNMEESRPHQPGFPSGGLKQLVRPQQQSQAPTPKDVSTARAAASLAGGKPNEQPVKKSGKSGAEPAGRTR